MVTVTKAESLEAELVWLRAENARLHRLLQLTPEQARPPGPTQTGLFLDHPGPVTSSSAGGDKVRFFRTLFAARRDVYATRWENIHPGGGVQDPKGGQAQPPAPASSPRPHPARRTRRAAA